MGRINNTQRYNFDQDVHFSDFVIGTDAITGKPTKNFMLLNIFRAFQEYSGLTNMIYSDITSNVYYYGGYYNRGEGQEWVLFRVTVDNGIVNKEQSTQVQNINISSLDDAWNDRINVVYTTC